MLINLKTYLNKGLHVVRRQTVGALTALLLLPGVALAGVDWVVNNDDTIPQNGSLTGYDPIAAGGDVVYTVSVGNNGSSAAPATTLTFIVPATTTFVSATGLTCSGTGPVTCTVPPLSAAGDPGDEVEVLFTVKTSVAGSIALHASVPAAGDDDATNNGLNVIEDQQTTVNAGADIALSVTAGPATAPAGSTVSYTFSAINNGPNVSNGFTLTVPVPTGYSNITPPGGCSLSGSNYICAIPGSVAVGATVNRVFSAQISAASGSNIGFNGSVTGGTPLDPISNNNTAAHNTTVTAGSDLRITKSRAPGGSLLVGQAATFTLTPSYTGDSPNGLTVTDNVPLNYTVGAVAVSQNGWACSVDAPTATGTLVTCTKAAGSVAGSNVSLGNISIPVNAANPGNPVNTGNIGATGPVDPNPANNSANDGGVTIVTPVVNLSANKSGPSPALVVVGNSYNYSISASNIGNAAFTGTLVMTDNLPAGLTVNGYNLNGWTCMPAIPVVGPQAITCQRVYTAGAPLAAGGTTPTVDFTNVTATAAGVINNSMTVSSIGANIAETDDLTNNTASYSVTSSTGPNSANISVVKTANFATVSAGNVLTYKLEVVNDGPQPSTNITLSDDFTALMNSSEGPTGAGYIGISSGALPTGWACSPSTVISSTSRRLSCTIASLPVCTAGSCPSIDVQVRPGGNGGVRGNSATAISSTTADPDLTNNTGSVNVTVTRRVDIAVSKTALPVTSAGSRMPAGQNLTYRVTATNIGNGLSSADAVTITDTLPDNLTFVSATPQSGSCTTPTPNSTTGVGNNQVVCNFGTLGNGVQQYVDILVRPTTATRGTTLTNTATVSTTTAEVAGTSADNTATVDTFVGNPVLDLLINKVDSVDPVAAGDNTIYTVTVTNQGPSAAENVVITDTLPAARLSYQSNTAPAGGSCSGAPATGTIGGTLTCNVAYLAAGASTSFTVTMRGVTKGSSTNRVDVSSNESLLGFDTNNTGGVNGLGNNSANQNTTVRTKADMQVVSKIKGPTAGAVNLRDDFNFTIKVRNNVGAGLDEADNVVVSDTLPAGMELTGTPTVAVIAGTASTTTCTGAAGSTSFTCDLGTVSSGGEMDILVPVQLVAVTGYSQTITNTASVLTSSLDINGGSNPAAGNNFNSGNVLVNSSGISGRVFRDFNNDSLVTAGDTGISGITMTLIGRSFDSVDPPGVNNITRTVTTDPSGNYTFANVPQGVYRVSEGPVTETNLVDGIDTPGVPVNGNATVNDVISSITLNANTTISGYNFAEVPVPRIGLAKTAGSVIRHGDGTYSVPFTLTVRNYGGTPLSSVQITDDLTGTNAAGKFGTYTANAVPAAGEFTIAAGPTVTAPTNGAALTSVAAGVYTGSGAGSALLIPATSSLPNYGSAATASQAQITFTVRFFPTTPGPFNNTAVTTAVSPLSGGTTVTDNSFDGGNPDPNGNGDPTDDASPTIVSLTAQSIGIAKSVSGIVQTGAKKYRIPYTLIVQNLSTFVTATNVQVTDNLITTFPTAVTRTVSVVPPVTACTGTVLAVASPAFNGIGQNNLLAGNQNLQPGERCTITITVDIDFGTNPLPTTVQNNQAVATTAATPGGTVIATDLSNDGNNPDPNGNGNANEASENIPTPVSFATQAAVTGTVYLDANHDRVNNDTLATDRVQGFIVEVLNAAGQIIGTTTTDASGNYTVGGLFPSTAGNAATYYSVRFREPASGAIYGVPQSNDPTAARNGVINNGVITALQLTPGTTTLQQNLPLDPSGVVYNSVTRTPVAGATVTLLNAGVPVPATCLVGGINTQTTGGSGEYQFLLINPNPAPGTCPGDGTYTLRVVQPGAYLPPASTLIPPQTATLTPPGAPGSVFAVQPQPSAPPTGSSTTYYFSLALTLGGVGVVNNHIPLDPVLGGAVALTKTTPLVNVGVGQLVPYTITARNTLAANLTNVDIRDTVPPGFKYQPGSARVDGVAMEPTVNGRVLTWSNLTLAPNAARTVKLMLIVGSGVQPGEYVNTAQAFNNLVPPPNPNAVSNEATATVRVTPDPTFDCSDLIGKVFDDMNTNGYQDDGEPGIPNVRLATARGWLVTTDAEGRFHVACAAVPDADRGSNFIMKLDERTLPTGYRVTTENPRDVRLTRGKMSKLNFGATIHKVIRVDMTDAAFEAGKTALKPEWVKQIAVLPQQLKARPSVLRLSYKAGAEGEPLARERLRSVSQYLREDWRKNNCCHTLLIEEEFFMPGKPASKEGK